jgi:ribonuclease D
LVIELHRGDLPDNVDFGQSVAIDTETLGLNTLRDRLCVVQLSAGDGVCHIVHFPTPEYSAPNLCRLVNDTSVLKLFHFARFDIAALNHYLGADCRPVYCTKIASRLTRTYTDRHGLKELCREFLGVDLSKEQQSSDWGAPELTSAQLEYAASDVLYLHRLKEALDARLARENRTHIAQAAFEFLPTRAAMDIAGFESEDIFAHS